MKWTRQVLQKVEYPYAVSIFECDGRKKAVTATELNGPCVGIWTDTLEQERIWENQGGTMNTCQLDEDGSFLAIQQFYRGFDSRQACLVKVDQKEGWKQTFLGCVPFLHRFCLVDVEGEMYIVCSVLCADKASTEDWSQPGCVKAARIPGEGQPLEFQVILEGIHRNHGMFCGMFRGKKTVLVTGDEGVFQIHIPERKGDPWSAEVLLKKPVSDCTVLDLDGDGQEEIVTIEPFHGGKAVVNQWTDGRWQEVYSYPVDFGHAIWSGLFLGKPAFLLGYRGANAALLLFRLKETQDGQWLMDVTCLDEHGGPTNVAVSHGEDFEQIFACNGGKHEVVLYTVQDR